MSNQRILITGGAGFIGSALIRQLIGETDCAVLNVDLLTYAGHLANLGSARSNPRYGFHHLDIADGAAVEAAITAFRPTAIMHLAAESHVDRSITGPDTFIRTNIVGTFTLLEKALAYWHTLSVEDAKRFRFLHVSTDEVYGALGPEGVFSETSQYQPNSPYSASKAASDHLVRAWFHTYGFPVLTTNCSNNYGPYQYPEKLIPLVIRNALSSLPLPIYGAGDQVRDWLYVEDHAKALRLILERGTVGEVYCIGGGAERMNLNVVQAICDQLDILRPKDVSYSSLIRHVDDRPGHDKRYAMDYSKMRNELGWKPAVTFEGGLSSTVEWYVENLDWCRLITSDTSRGLGEQK